MAALGTIGVFTPEPTGPTPVWLISDYDVIRGRPLGTITAIDNKAFMPEVVGPVETYIVRQLQVVFRQLWPARGQRFPQ